MAKRSLNPRIDNKLKQRIISRLRKEFHWSNLKKQTLAAAMYNDNYKCKECQDYFPRNGVHVDHIIQVVDPDLGFQGFDTFVDRLFCEPSNLQVLCKPCHRVKTHP